MNRSLLTLNVTSGVMPCDIETRLTQHRLVLVILAVLTVMLSVFTVLSNVTIVLALVKSSFQPLKDPTNHRRRNRITEMLMASLAVSDFLVGSFALPVTTLEIIDNGRWRYGQALCYGRNNIGNTFLVVSIYHILCMAIDRYLAICKPFRYLTMSSRVAGIMIAISWAIPTTIMIFPTINNWHRAGFEPVAQWFQDRDICMPVFKFSLVIVGFVVGMFIPLVSTYVLYGFILRKIWHQKHIHQQYKKKSMGVSEIRFNRKNNGEIQIISFSNIDRESGNGVTFNERNIPASEPSRISKHNLKAYRAVGGVILCFTLCWLPLGIFMQIQASTSYCLPLLAMQGLTVLSYTNPAVNPILYCGSRSIRNTVKSFFSCTT